MINCQTIERFKVSDFEKIMNTRIKITFKNPIKHKSLNENEYTFIGQIIGIGVSANTPYLPVDIDFLIENSDVEISQNIYNIDNIEI